MSLARTAYDIARKQVFYCDVSTPLAEVAGDMARKNIGSILVKQGEKLKGIITMNDFLRQIANKRKIIDMHAEDIMSSPVITANKDLEIDELIETFNRHGVSRLVLVDNKNRIVGVVRDIAVHKFLTFFQI